MSDASTHLTQAIEYAALWLEQRQGVTIKSIAQVVREYRDELTNIVYDVFNGRSDATDMRRAHKALLKSHAEPVYIEGMNEGGLKEEDFDEDDLAQIEEDVGDWLGKQIDEVNGFAKDTAAAAKDKDLRHAILDRLEMWVDSLRTLGDMGKAYALKSEKGEWRYGDTEHCDTCLKLNGKVHRVSWFLDRGYIPGENGSETLDCKGFKCQCGIYSVKNGKRIL